MAKGTMLDLTKKSRQTKELENNFCRLVFGQDEAIHQIVRAYQAHLAAFPRSAGYRKLSVAGSTGCGKTRVVSVTAAASSRRSNVTEIHILVQAA